MKIDFISDIFKGLVESFPQFGLDYLMYYLYSKPGINQNLSIEELTTVRVNGKSEDT
jgi:hypothetical protein